MAKSLNVNIFLIAGGVVAALYFINKIKTAKTTEYETSTGSYIDATQPTIRTDIRQTEKTERTEARQATLQSAISAVSNAYTETVQAISKKASSKNSITNKSPSVSTSANNTYKADGTLIYSGQGYSVAPAKVESLKAQLSQTIYRKGIVTNPFNI